MSETTAASAVGEPGPSTTTLETGATPDASSSSRRGKEPQRDGTEDRDFDVTDPQDRQDCLVPIPHADIEQRLVMYEDQIRESNPKMNQNQKKLLARDYLIDHYRELVNQQMEYGWKFHNHILHLEE